MLATMTGAVPDTRIFVFALIIRFTLPTEKVVPARLEREFPVLRLVILVAPILKESLNCEWLRFTFETNSLILQKQTQNIILPDITLFFSEILISFLLLHLSYFLRLVFRYEFYDKTYIKVYTFCTLQLHRPKNKSDLGPFSTHNEAFWKDLNDPNRKIANI